MGLCTCISDCVADNQPQSLSGNNSSSIIQSIKQCHSAAKQTVELCTSTLATGKNLVRCGESIQRSLVGAATDLDAESFAVIADLIDGDKTKEAEELAVTMKEKSTECISLSMRMVQSLEKSVDALPDIIESFIEKKAQQSITDELTSEEREMANGIDDDAQELSRCIDAIENLNLLTAIDAGKNAFEAIKDKSKLCHRIFQMIQKFATDVSSITEAISNMDASAVLSKVKDGSILKAIGLSKYIKQFAEGCKRVMDKIVELFHGAAGKLSTLWRALSHAKDVMVNSLTEVVNSRSLCGEASEKAEKLKQMTTSLGNIEALKLIKSLSGDRDRSMNDAMGTAREVDVGMEDAALKMKSAAKMVGDEYLGLPSIITDGITDDTDAEVANSFGAKIKDINSDIQDLEMASKAIEDSDIFHAAKTMHKEMSSIPEKVDTCQELVQSCTDFADRSKSSIDSFLGKWSLDDAVSHIKEMCRLVSFSKLMEQLADQIHKLIKAIMTLLRVMSAKIQAVADQLKSSGLDSVVDAAGDLVSDGLNSMMGKVFGK
mmetsp:Transcript_12497/g.27126  ORF Transcript_12497/g.27126 Transcript_12497/m.27126 type:complete len:546 (+) Transcript_12497:173-1810(+)|eukprot:CAMPEP_0172322654 /NCGR_PEP_ID=MMETSP1058-20130122/46508_1 /TAXON_ID=83371 /ORGANISM="Detonula confervacea, Strain CCMP 353" /LENGTH=545 /DNA_ID=CAMNT_0013038457 /DNA_START=163 /DNA_END=1800 /DNA_ORIENTATION=-